ncbi:MAG: PAC2 family protein [Aigarchaeota archaeon]|nr:PAC2 family protein [Aigarchaeota archaeon]MDW8093245.1 PAC2 family protein [Nitrososphaerota archaeon]
MRPPLYLYTEPKLRDPAIIIGMAGWPDAGGVSSQSISYLKELISAVPLGEIDMSDHLDLTRHRPMVVIQDGMVKSIELPKFEIHYAIQANRDVILISGYEPLKGWNVFVNGLFGLIKTFGASLLLSIGGLVDAVPHTRPVRISFLTTSETLRDSLRTQGFRPSNYAGPGSIHSFIMQKASELGVKAVSIWGHVPSYLTMPNPRIISTILEKVSKLVGIEIDLSRLYVEASIFEGRLNDIVANDPEMKKLVERLEKEYDNNSDEPSYIK